jgi:hypothetical protein
MVTWNEVMTMVRKSNLAKAYTKSEIQHESRRAPELHCDAPSMLELCVCVCVYEFLCVRVLCVSLSALKHVRLLDPLLDR